MFIEYDMDVFFSLIVSVFTVHLCARALVFLCGKFFYTCGVLFIGIISL